MILKRICFLVLVALTGCQHVVVDPSIDAIAARDLTLVHSACSPESNLCINAIQACSAVPNGGFDACRFIEGTPIQSAWIIYVPYGGRILGGTLSVKWKDIVKTYNIAENQKTIRIPWRDFFGDGTWQDDYSGIAIAVANLRVIDENNLEAIKQARGEARILVLAKGYEPLPIDSGYAAFGDKITCTYIYTTKGRSAINCK